MRNAINPYRDIGAHYAAINRAMTPNKPRTKEGAFRQYNALINAYRRDFAGGGLFGFDWPTFRMNDPERYARVQELRALFPSLPSRKR